ncbi:MAG TPA: VanW family protein [Chloroflexota bacterium]|nr:VanW family protein [Chloroflexota bacterium]
MNSFFSGALARGLSVLAALVVFAGCAALGLEIAGRDRILPGVVVLGVPVGGLTLQDATARLGPTSAAILDQPLTAQVGERTWSTTPRALGLRLDPAELADSAFSVGHAGSTSFGLQEELAALRSETVVSVTSASTGSALDDFIKRIASEVDTPPVTAALDLGEDGTLTFQTSQTGLALDQAGSRALMAQALAEGRSSVTLLTRTLQPAIETEQVAAAHDQLVRILSDPGPIQLNAGEQHWTIERSQLLDTVALSQPDGPGTTASVDVHVEPLQALVQTIAPQIDRDSQEARFTWASGQLSLLRPSIDGQALNQSAAIDSIVAAIQAGQRSVELPVDVVHPAVASDDAARLGIRELIGESTTAFAGAIPEKAHNIQLAAQRLNGVVVPPGGTFSFNKEVGPTTLEAGFEWGFGLTGGGSGVHTVPSVAGGICQVATTLFQPVFWSGYQIEERYWHLYWIPSYTSRGVVGLDATVDADSGLDFKWINPTDQPVLIQASTDAEHVTFRLYGQKPPWNVQVDDPVISDRVAADPTPAVQEEPSLPWGRTLLVESARDGFTVLLNRRVTPTAGGPVRELALKSIYAPAQTVTLVGARGAPDAQSVTAAVEQLRASQLASVAQATQAASAPPTHATPNGPRTIAQIREELQHAGWGGGSDQDALDTYQRLAAAAAAH